MARETNTRELVREIALEVLNRGEKPTQAMVRRVILEKHGRTASPNLVMNELNSVLIDSAGINAKRFALPGLPDAVSESVTALWTVACEQSDALVADKVRQTEEREIAAEQTVLAIESKLATEKSNSIGLQHDLALVNQSLEQKILVVTECHINLKETVARLDAANLRNADLAADKIRVESAATQRITEIELNNRLEMERMRAEHEKAVEILNNAHAQEAVTWEGLRNHLMMQTDQIRQGAREKDEAQRAKIADLEIRTAMLTRKANDAQDDGSRMRGVIETLEKQITKLEMNAKIARETHLSAIEAEKNKITEMEKWLAATSADLNQAFLKVFNRENT